MRTTVDLPDSLLIRVKSRLAERKLTFRALVISALEQTLQQPNAPFTLRDASVGETDKEPVLTDTINNAINKMREPSFQQ